MASCSVLTEWVMSEGALIGHRSFVVIFACCCSPWGRSRGGSWRKSCKKNCLPFRLSKKMQQKELKTTTRGYIGNVIPSVLIVEEDKQEQAKTTLAKAV